MAYHNARVNGRFDWSAYIRMHAIFALVRPNAQLVVVMTSTTPRMPTQLHDLHHVYIYRIYQQLVMHCDRVRYDMYAAFDRLRVNT